MKQKFAEIVCALKHGEIGVLATDTLYGIVGSALRQDVVERIYTVRKRAPNKPCIILISSVDDIYLFSIQVDQNTKKELSKYWPGPVSIIFPCPNEKFAYLHRGEKSLAFRVPADKKLLEVLKQTGPLLAPSANIEGKPPAETVEQAGKYFGKNVDFYVDAGIRRSLPSTILRFEKGVMSLVREGAVSFPAQEGDRGLRKSSKNRTIYFMRSDEVRKRYLDFFKKRGHAVIPSFSIVPENDPTTLFTGSGMQPMLPFLLGEDHPLGTRVADSQKCFRAEDIEEVGDNRHTTFFEMLGNWSFGDYFNQEQLPWIFEFLTEEIGLDPNNLYVTVFSGSEKNDLPRDTESALIWKKLFAEKGIEAKEVEMGSEERGGQVGMQGGRIFYYDEKKNWWSRAGVPDNMPAGEPGGSNSEMFYDFGTSHNKKYGEHCHPNCDCGRFMEIGNNVFMKYKKKSDGTFEKLPKKNVDFGGGLERITAAANNNSDMFAIDTLGAVVKEIENLSGKSYSNEQYTRSFRIIADHLRGAVFMIGDGIIPSNTEAGYFTRRLLRRAVRHMDLIGMQENTLFTLVPVIVEKCKEQYPNLLEKQTEIEKEIETEEERFRKTLEKGLKELEKLKLIGKIEEKLAGKKIKAFNRVDAKKAFYIFQTFGFPLEMIQEELAKRVLFVDEEEFKKFKNEFKKGFDEEMKKHQALSKAGAEQKFKGGLADQGEISVKYHTATHLLHQALHKVLGENALQKGSNITGERMRFDFAHPQKLTDDEKKQIEDLVNQKIKEALPVTYEDVSLEKARELGATGLFTDKYGDVVRVYKIGKENDPFSMEICGGPHVENTGELGYFSIKKEEASSAGVRRIKAVLE